MKDKYFIYKTDIFAINLPLNWKVGIYDFIYSFYDPSGIGALQISTYTKKNKIKIDFIEEIKRII